MPSSPEKQAISVGEALQIAKVGLESIRLSIIGEVSGFTGNRYPTKYFSLKDEKTAMSCVMWANVYNAAGIDLKDGQEIEIEGKFSVFEKRGDMNFHVSKIRVAGQGQIRIELAQREARLRAEGLFDASRKKPIPKMPQKIAVVTSGGGAVIHDIIKTLGRRWPYAELLFYGVGVDTKDAVTQIISGLSAADASDADLVILARGGGSFEDLLPFSDEELVRFIAGMSKPLVSGVGHEPDVTLTDHVADLRAATPTAAAEAASSPSQEELKRQILDDAQKIHIVLSRKIHHLENRLESISKRPVFAGPEALLQVRAMMLDSVLFRMESIMSRGFSVQAARLESSQRHLLRVADSLTAGRRASLEKSVASMDALSPLKVFGRGYAAAFDKESGSVLKSVNATHEGQEIIVKLSDGTIDCEVRGIHHG